LVAPDLKELDKSLSTVPALEFPAGQSVDTVLGGPEILALQETVRRVPCADHVVRYAMALVRATRVGTPEAPDFVRQWLAWGSGPRATQYLILGGKARSVLHGRHHVSTGDIRAMAYPVLRHRLITNFTAEAEGVTPDTIIQRLLETTSAHGEVEASDVAAAAAGA
jgi:MoxR-like ATPase